MHGALREGITIVVTTADRNGYLDQCLASVREAIASDSVPATVLVVDDGTQQAAGDVATRHGAEYIIHPDRHRTTDPSAARVFALQHVTSSHFAFFDDDDIMLPGHLRHMRSANADLCHTGYFLARERDGTLQPIRKVIPRPARLGDLLGGWNSINDGCLFRTDRARELEWNAALADVMMYSVFLQALVAGWRVTRTGRATFLYRQHSLNRSRRLSHEDATTRAAVIGRYRAAVLARDGRVPPMHWTVRARRAAARLMGRGV